jgi:hypothetical protein
LFIELGRPPRAFQIRGGNIRFHHHYFFGGEAHLNFQQCVEAADQQSGAGHQHHRNRYFHDDQRAVQAPRTATGSAARDGLLQGLVQIDAGRVQRRRDAKDHRGNRGRRKRERQHPPVESDFIQPRNIGRREAHQQRRNPNGDQQAQPARSQRQ